MREYLERYLDLILRLMRQSGQQQGTRAFVAGRTKIGASEASHLNTCTPRSLLTIVRNKVMPSQTKAVALLWGNVFEDAHVDVLQLLYGERLHRTPGNLPGPDGTSSSPDAVGIVFDGQRYMLALYELKCLFSRLIERDKPMIAGYLAQVLWGLNVLNSPAQLTPAPPLFEVGIFSEAVFRLCTADEFDFSNAHNGALQRGPLDASVLRDSGPICIGVQYVIALRGCEAVRDLYGSPDVIDFGADDNFRDLLSLERNVDYRVEVGQIFINKGKNAKPFLRAYPVGCLGVLHWKLFDLHLRKIAPDPNYIEARRPLIDLVGRAVREAREHGIDSVAERLVACSHAPGVELLAPHRDTEDAKAGDVLLDMEL